MKEASPLREQLATEVVLKRIASRFAGTRDVDSAVQEALRDLGEHCRADCAFVFQADPDGAHFSQTHEWRARGFEPPGHLRRRIPISDGTSGASVIGCSGELSIEDVYALSESERGKHPQLKACPGRSFLSVPIHVNGQTRGCAGLAMLAAPRKWTQEDAAAVNVFAQLLGSVLARKEAEDELVESQTRYANLFRDSSDAVFIHDFDGRIVDANRRAMDLFGYSREEFLKMKVQGLHPTSRLEQSRQALRGVADEGSSVFETTMMKSSGEEFAAEVSAGRFPTLHGWLVQGIVRDISGRKRAEAEREALESRLRQSQKMEAIGELAGGIAQDFNNMLHAIDGTLDAFESEPGCTRVHHALINEIRGVTSRATQTTRQLLSFARRGQFQSVPVDMHSLLNETRRLLVSAADRRIQIITAFHAANRTVLGDPVQIQTTILHLGLNARDAMPRGGILTMATRNTREEGTDGERLEITVADTGVGMTPEIMSHIFEPFFTTKKQGEGTGMGLAGVYGCITGLNGRISVRSEPGKGSVFTIDLPLYEGAVEPVPETQPAAASSATGHVMVVDDEEIVRNATARVLTHLGYRVTVCADGEEALRLFLQKADEFDLVILDMMMPNMNGEETFRRMREEDPNVRVLVASGFSRDETVDRMLANGARGFLSKPFRVSELSMQIQRHVRVRPKSPV